MKFPETSEKLKTKKNNPENLPLFHLNKNYFCLRAFID